MERINQCVDLLEVENQTFDELIEAVNAFVSEVFEDRIYNWARFCVLEVFAKVFAERATQVDRDLLLTALNQRIESEYNGI